MGQPVAIKGRFLRYYTDTYRSIMKELRLLLIIYSVCLCHGVWAQPRRVQNKPFIDERQFHYGFFAGIHDQTIQLQNSGYTDPATGQQWVAQADQMGLGFSVGVLGEWKLSRYVSVRAVPSLHFGSKHVVMRDLSTDNRESQDLKSCYVGVPIDVKLAAPRFNNYRPYIIAGLSPMYDLGISKQAKLKVKPFTLMAEVGMGCDFYMPFFKFIPELKFCFGLGNVLQKNRPDLTDPSQLIYTQSIERATVSMVVLSFYFE